MIAKYNEREGLCNCQSYMDTPYLNGTVPESYGPDDMERDEIGPSMRLIDSPKGKFLVDLYKLLECWDLISDFASGKLTLAELDRAYVERLFGTDVPQSETFDEYVLRLKKRWDARGS